MNERTLQNKIIKAIRKQDPKAIIYKPPDVRRCPRCGTPVLTGGKRLCDLIVIAGKGFSLKDLEKDEIHFPGQGAVHFFEFKYYPHRPKNLHGLVQKKLTPAQSAALRQLYECGQSVTIAIQCGNGLFLIDYGELI